MHRKQTHLQRKLLRDPAAGRAVHARNTKLLLTTKVHLSEADLFIDRICAIIQKQRFVRPDEGGTEQIGKQGVLESWKEKN